VSLLLERVEMVCRSGELLVGLWSRASLLCGGDGLNVGPAILSLSFSPSPSISPFLPFNPGVRLP
jgi:hypothetical protein